MDELSLYEDIFNLSTLISLVFKRGPEFGEYQNPSSASNSGVVCDSASSENLETEEDEGIETVDETEFEGEISPGDSDAALAVLKRRALDRFAEALARFKTAKDARPRGKAKNVDAKHVTSVVMIEEDNHERVTMFCSKNEGVDANDEKFLGELKELLQSISGNGKIHDKDRDSVFDIMFHHQQPRVEFYSSILRGAFNRAAQINPQNTLTHEIVESQLQHRQSWKWEDNHGLEFTFCPGGLNGFPVSEVAVDCLSDQEKDRDVSAAFCEIQNIYGNKEASKDPIQLKGLLKRLYAIIRHGKQRPALKNLLRQAFHNDERVFRKAWDALLFLVRIFHGADTLVELASKLKSFNSIEFIPVPATTFTTEFKSESNKKPLEVLSVLDGLSLNKKWKEFFGNKKTIKNYMDLLRVRRTVHAEVQMICYLDTNLGIGPGCTGDIFPYIRCSKKCCFFCEAFRVVHGKFSARGTHETVFPKWALPQAMAATKNQESVSLMREFLELLKDILLGALAMPYPLPHRDLLQQSSAALSTAQAVQREQMSYTERPIEMTKVMLPLGVVATDRQVKFTPLYKEPGYASFLAPSMPHMDRILPIEQAEMCKINNDRENSSLERMDQMPPERDVDRKLCRLCHKPSKTRCSACWTWYCTRACQKRDWSTHLFTCRIPKRPNAVDYLKLIVKRVRRAMITADEEIIQNSLLELFADDDTCCTFGFNNCSSSTEAINLVCLYGDVISSCRSPSTMLYGFLEAGKLADFLELFCKLSIERTDGRSECDCMPWFLARRAKNPFPIPDLEKKTYEIWITARSEAMDCLDVLQRITDGCKFNRPQTEVFNLFVMIQPSVRRLPDVYSSTWLNFGFCYCQSFQQRQELAAKYLALASSSATFDDIVSAYETSTMADLMTAHGVNLSSLRRHGVKLHKPPPCEYSVLRLMTAVKHALSGRYCSCFQMREGRACHKYFETHLDCESDVSYGFHLSNSWERWQLLNFYQHLFKIPGFDVRQMAEAKERQEKGSLEKYLDTLVPNMRRKIFDINRADSILFPSLDGHLTARTKDGKMDSHYHLPCDCKVHDVVGPPGICHLRVDQIIDCASPDERTVTI